MCWSSGRTCVCVSWGPAALSQASYQMDVLDICAAKDFPHIHKQTPDCWQRHVAETQTCLGVLFQCSHVALPPFSLSLMPTSNNLNPLGEKWTQIQLFSSSDTSAGHSKRHTAVSSSVSSTVRRAGCRRNSVLVDVRLAGSVACVGGGRICITSRPRDAAAASTDVSHVSEAAHVLPSFFLRLVFHFLFWLLVSRCELWCVCVPSWSRTS